MIQRSILRPIVATIRTSSFRARYSSSPTKLQDNPYIFVFPLSNSTNLLTLLPTNPPTPSLALGHCTSARPTPSTFTENPDVFPIIHEVLAAHATEDPVVRSQAAMFASQAGSALGKGGMLFSRSRASQQRHENMRGPGKTGRNGSDSGGAGGASNQGGIGGAGRGGFVHVSDMRNPPDFGRVAWPEDIFGSLEVDGTGEFVDGTGRYQSSGTYRMVTNEGIFGLPDTLRKKLVARLTELEQQLERKS
ncbi:hypothetical protein EJ05DRAFT_221730 [Pseudovirgaria hyperparasitica]|uniref:Uncharacterized protein n=1 Tax=Pseudovirgaria hyperparasitica TaxID=470096 RepID=A0A6A6VTL2_9PEZI|nr:uncharacterized protein EJ05DRAFT_221730 [Pseudovirgaria hyperparasitica]KAF2753553.1 hypothetical protein EJ05DRAFT_221730 [Pseudovirgaria hyperparasitica]